ncbi:hypothetical protein EK21DRAFT_86740 [Setomelanomma holmii]|uniref:Uncharacterized protein n=1 Tax=Setomelanomma holmii TaxID=210430 RepID=A0A9P4HEX9_9PLEO|nr:hypothetical protein EK21DRAFT_86740 [Setomelanomma holmii]
MLGRGVNSSREPDFRTNTRIATAPNRHQYVSFQTSSTKPPYSSHSSDYYLSLQNSYYSSLLADISSTAAGQQTQNSYYSWLLADISSAAAAQSSYVAAATDTGAAHRTGTTSTNALVIETGTISSSSSSSGHKNHRGELGKGAKAGIGVAVPLIVLIVGLVVAWMKKRKVKKTFTPALRPNVQIARAPVYQYQPPQQQQQPTGYDQQQQHHPVAHAPTPTVQMPPQHGASELSGTHAPAPGSAEMEHAHEGTNQYTGPYGGYKAPEPGVAEIAHEYDFARPGIVEIGDAREEVPSIGGGKGRKSKLGWF